MPTIRLKDGANIEYIEAGKENIARGTIIFVHGWGMAGKAFDKQSELAKNYHIIALDLRACGHSSLGNLPLCVKTLGEDVFEIIALLELENVHLVGWSMGAMALWLNSDKFQNLKSIAFIDMSPKITNEIDWPHGIINSISLDSEQGKERLARALSGMEADWQEFAQRMVKRIFAKSKDFENGAAIMLAEAYEISKINNPQNMACLWESLTHCDARENLSDINIPCLLLHGLDNQLYEAALGKYVQSQIDGAQLVEFKNSGHAPHMEEAAKFNDALSQFIESIEAKTFYQQGKEEKGNGSLFTK